MEQYKLLSNISTIEALRSIYVYPNQIILDKVASHIDRHAKTFIDVARFVALNVRGPDGAPIPILAGGKTGFAQVVDPVTVEIDVVLDAWPSDKLQVATSDRYAAGLIFIVPGVKETLRMKGWMTVVPSTDVGTSQIRLRLRIDNNFFHCAKAFMRSRIWDAPQELTRWKGLRSFKCVCKVRESDVITSFYFRPVDGGALPVFQPGQHVPIEVAIPGQAEPLRRAYSLSNRPGEDTIRISVKREQPPAIGSGYLHDHVGVESVVKMRNPTGQFVLDVASMRPVVLLSAGVGLTPMISMLDHLVATGSSRRIWFVHGAISGREHALGAHVREIARTHENVRVHVSYGRPRKIDQPGRDFDTEGRLSVDLLKNILPWDDYEFYVCGPLSFMTTMIEALTQSGVMLDRIRWEAFSSKKSHGSTPHQPIESARLPAATLSNNITVEFQRSQKVVKWASECTSLLELAEISGVAVQSSCRNGTCFTCATRIISGEVSYTLDLDEPPEDGIALICSARPCGDVVLDL